MLIYNIVRSNALPVSAQDFFTIISNATRSMCLLEVDCQGMGTTSAATEATINRVTTAGVTGASAITPVPVNPAQPAFGGTCFAGWTTQPVVGAVIQNLAINSNGQRVFWRAMPNFSNAIWSPGGATAAGSLSIRPITISGNWSIRAQVGEI